jgi:CelD/BcsL family acetyltransferase involved in cellulose biosynthesis
MKVLALAGEVKDRLRLSTISPLFRDHRGNDLMHRTMKELGRMKWNLLTAVNLEDNGANRMFIDAVRANWQTEEFPPARKMTLDLPAEGSLMSSLDKKTRKNLEYRRRLLEREGHTMEFRKVCAEDIDPAVDIYAKHHIERWEKKGGSYFRNPENVEFLKRYAGLTCRSGQGHFYELRIDGQVAAQDLYLLDGNVVYGDKTGMNNDFLRYSPGWFIQIHALDELRDMGAERYVMGIGGERYKSEMGAVESPLLGIRATRGRASMLGRLSRTSAFKYLDERLDLTKRTIDVQGESPEA